MSITTKAAALFLCGLAIVPQQPAQAAQKDATTSPDRFHVTKITPAYWRVTIDLPPFNIFGPDSVPAFEKVVAQIETDPDLKVVVFDSAAPDFFLTHYDFSAPLKATTDLAPGPTGLAPLPDLFVRLSKAPVVSIVKIRGRASGVGSELALASDMRFASREKAVLSQFEIGAGFTPGGGPMARLPRLVGRGRALEILLAGDDLNADVAERYGYINRALPDRQLDGFVDRLARRIASFDKRSLSEIKARVNAASLPPDGDIGEEWRGFIASVQRPAAQRAISELMRLGLQKDPEIERHLPHYTALVNGDAEK